MYAWSVYKHDVAAFCIYAQCGEDAAKGEVGGRALNSHGNYIVDHGKSWKNHAIVFLNFCGTLKKGNFSQSSFLSFSLRPSVTFNRTVCCTRRPEMTNQSFSRT